MDWFDLWCRTQLHKAIRESGHSVDASDFDVYLTCFRLGAIAAHNARKELERRFAMEVEDGTERQAV